MINYQRILIFIFAIILGFLAMQQINLKARIQQLIDPQKTNQISLEVAQLIKDNKKLLVDLQLLQEQKQKLSQAFSSDAEKEESLESSLDQLKIITGKSEVAGQGITIIFEKNLEQTQLVDFINALKNIGAEAISINGKRIIVTSGLSSNEFSAPYQINAIGDSRILEDALTRKGGIIEQIGGGGKVKTQTQLTIPAIP